MNNTKTIGNNNRLEWLDVLKCIGMYIVVIGHASNAVGVDTYRYYIYSFHMPLFFIISGMTFYLQFNRREWTFENMLKNKARTLIWPYFALNLLALPIWYLNFRVLSYRDQPISSLIIAIFYSNQHEYSSATNATWFILTLFLALMVLFVVLKWAKNNEYIIVLSGAIFCLLGFASSLQKPKIHLPWHIDTVPMAVALLVLGYVFISKRDAVTEFFKPLYIKLAGIIFFLFAGFCFARYNADKITMHGNNYGSIIMFLGAVVCLSMVCFLVSMMLPPLGIFKLVGRNTIVMLAFHAPCFRFCSVYSETTAAFKNDHPILLGTIVFIIMIPVCFIIEKILPFIIGRPYKNKIQKGELQK